MDDQQVMLGNQQAVNAVVNAGSQASYAAINGAIQLSAALNGASVGVGTEVRMPNGRKATIMHIVRGNIFLPLSDGRVVAVPDKDEECFVTDQDKLLFHRDQNYNGQWCNEYRFNSSR